MDGMSPSAESSEGNGQGFFYEIRIEGNLPGCWSDWLAGMDIQPEDCGETRLYGPMMDQAHLIGVLNQLQALNLTLISVRRFLPQAPASTGQQPENGTGI